MSTYGQIKIKKDSEAAKLIKMLGSKNRAEFDPATEAFAAFIVGVILQVVEQSPVVGNLFATESYNENTSPSIPLDVYFDIRDRDYIQVWTQTMPGGLATSFIQGLNEMMVSTYELDTAVSMLKKYARNARLDVLAASMERMAQEILIKQEINSANIISKALADARYTNNETGASTPQVLRATEAGIFQLDDLNRLITLLQRVRPSWVGGTPVGGNTISHLIGSPELMEEIRSMAYEPVNTRAGSENTSGATALPASDGLRAEVFNAAGNVSFFGINLVNVFEMGKGNYSYNQLFSSYAGATTFGGSAFTPANEQIVWALNLNANPRALTRLVQESDGGGRLQVMPDDSFPMRSEKFGYYGRLTEGRVVLDHRALAGCIF